ncbi:MAG: helix-turn-helix transcriptional regulator [gamma proteobacterium endosymbiont of Lamellibrachia anaximandri]|nr:helix-turn-helix transcriptional regulator [gamma proteobacterium endosymbiont of Lamellibrachia anaximandri]
MIRVLLKKLLDEKSFKERKRITLNEVSQETGISRATLTRISNVPGYNTNTDTLNTLCRFFECEPGELLELRDDEE